MSELDGKVVLVTGAASGMGAACAERAVSAGARVFMTDREDAGLSRLARRIDAEAAACDLTDLDQVSGLVERCVEAFGSLDGLVNAAGIFQTRKLLEVTPADFDAVFAINLRSLVFLQQAAAKAMIANGGGSIVNFASTAARVPRPISSHYAASKAAVVSLSRSAATALGPQGVRVNAVCPGVIQTPMIDAVRREWSRLEGVTEQELDASWREAIPLRRLGTPEEVAEVVAFLLGDASSYVTGESIGIHGGIENL